MARRGWESLTPAYRQRLTRAGVTRAQYERGESLQAARGHAGTPERPERAVRHPGQYGDYLARRDRMVRRFMARKERLFSDVHKFNVRRAAQNALVNPITGQAPTMQFMTRFLKMSAADVDRINWPKWNPLTESWDGDVIYAVLWYH